MSVPVKQKAPLRNRIIPWYFVMGFMVVLAVNIFFVRTALRMNSGVVTEYAYEKGLNYNKILAELKTEQALGWKSQVCYDHGILRVTVTDRDGKPLRGAMVSAMVDRPLQEGLHDTVTLAENAGEGYSAPYTLPLPGQWDITVSITWNKQYTQLRQRVIVR